MDIDTARAVLADLEAAADARKAAWDVCPCEAIAVIHNNAAVGLAYHKGFIEGHEAAAAVPPGECLSCDVLRKDIDAQWDARKEAERERDAYRAVVDALLGRASARVAARDLRLMADDQGDSSWKADLHNTACALEKLPAALAAVGCDNCGEEDDDDQ